VTVTLAYFAYPYVTLYRLGSAVQSADAATLEKLVDWPAVREGIKEDICDMVVDDGPAAPGKLPAFGSGFVRSIASNAIDEQVTPQAIAAASAGPRAHASPAGAMSKVRVNWAFFDSPTVFTVDLQAKGMQEPIRMQLDLRHGLWQVRRVWLPEDMLKGPPART
jgi:hypothetical protein